MRVHLVGRPRCAARAPPRRRRPPPAPPPLQGGGALPTAASTRCLVESGARVCHRRLASEGKNSAGIDGPFRPGTKPSKPRITVSGPVQPLWPNAFLDPTSRLSPRTGRESREGHVRDVGRVRVQGRRRRGRGEQPEDSAASRARPAVPAAVLVPAPPSARVFARPALAGGQRHAGSRRRAAPRREQRSASCRRAPPRCGAPRAPLPMGERSLGAAAPGAGMTWTRRSSFTRRRSGSSPTTRTCSTRRARSACRPGAPRMRSGCSRAA